MKGGRQRLSANVHAFAYDMAPDKFWLYGVQFRPQNNLLHPVIISFMNAQESKLSLF